MLQSWHTPKGNCSCLWTTSPRPVKTLGWSSVQRRQMSWAKTYQHHQSSSSVTMSSKSFTNSCTLGPPSLITSPLTLRSTRGLGRQPQHLLAWHQECGPNPKLTMKMKMAVYNACVLSTLLYGSETWTMYTNQEKRLNTFHLRSLWHILSISWQDKVPNTDILCHAGLPTMYTLLRQCQLCWLGHVHHMEDCQIPKVILNREITSGQRSTGHPQLRYKDACKRDMKALNININSWEDLAADCTSWRSMLHKQLQSGKKKLTVVAAEKQAHKKEMAANRPESMHRCDLCNRDCHSHIGLYSHRRHCSSQADSLDK